MKHKEQSQVSHYPGSLWLDLAHCLPPDLTLFTSAPNNRVISPTNFCRDCCSLAAGRNVFLSYRWASRALFLTVSPAALFITIEASSQVLSLCFPHPDETQDQKLCVWQLPKLTLTRQALGVKQK